MKDPDITEIKKAFINEDGSFNLIDSGRYVNDTFVTGKKFWLTHVENCYITDYHKLDESLLFVLNRNNGKTDYISKLMLSDANDVIRIIDALL